MVKVIDSNGVVLDCSGASSQQLRDAADGGKRGVVLKSEGMEAPKDMQGIVSGRVHNALYYTPLIRTQMDHVFVNRWPKKDKFSRSVKN